ncbi:tyrosine-type recombinase/integrase [Eisenbergiella porci]|jgi:integrase|uniref:tyrosine-type recombinase/integrase n=1 Tax=Eisenbergiella porci TaxID=2652274 RepID=UPI003AB65D62
MSIQEKTKFYKRQNKEITKYYAWVYNPNTGANVPGPLRLKRADAVKDEANILKAIEAGEKFEKKKEKEKIKTTVREVYTYWIESARNEYANSTYEVYKYYYSHFIDKIWGDIPILKIKPVHIQNYINDLGKTGEEHKAYSAETINKIINILSRIFHFSVDVMNLLSEDKNPMKGIGRLKITLNDMETWTPEQQADFFNCPLIRQSHYFPLLCVSALGPRPGEVCGLAEKDYLRDKKLLKMSRGYDKYNVLSDMKTQKSHRPLSLSDFICHAIDHHLAWKKEMRRQYPGFADNNFLFVSTNGRPINPDVYSKGYKKLLNKYNAQASTPLPPIALYNIRHSFATNNLLLDDVSPALVADVLGNSVKTVLSRYAHVTTDMRRQVTENYSEKLFTQKSG